MSGIRAAWIALLLPALAACSHNVRLDGRTSGRTGHAKVVTGGSSGDIVIDLDGTPYTGRWVFVSNGGVVGVTSASAFSGARSATATGNFNAISTKGNGSIVASSGAGGRLRCSFDYDSWGSTGVGICEDNTGEVYDLQID